MLPLNLSDTASTSEDGSSLEFIAAIAGRHCYIQDAVRKRSHFPRFFLNPSLPLL